MQQYDTVINSNNSRIVLIHGVFVAFLPILGYTGRKSKTYEKVGDHMATDSMAEKVTYPCEPVTENELLHAIFLTVAGDHDECQKLQAITSKISVEDVRWTFVRYLWILGSAYQGCDEALEAAGMKPGVYTNRNGDWLLLIHPEETVIQTALNLSGKSLKLLELYHTALQNLDVSSCTDLKSFCVENDMALSTIHGLPQLKLLTTLRIRGCSSLTQLPPMDNLDQLTELDLSGCSSLIQLPLPDSLTRLTELYLSGCGITELPDGIRSMKALRRLDIGDLKLRELPDWLPEIAERFSLVDFAQDNGGENRASVFLGGTTVDDIPDMSIFEQPYEMVAKWFEERRVQTQPLNEIKVVFLGDGEAGKSHTIARLMNDGGDPDHAVFDGWSGFITGTSAVRRSCTPCIGSSLPGAQCMSSYSTLVTILKTTAPNTGSTMSNHLLPMLLSCWC